MPRLSQAEKEKSHKRILDAAAELMRRNGVTATSVSDVMKAAGMTHGGFYRHFDSKEDLVAEAVRHAVEEVTGELEAAPSEADKSAARAAYVERYLSPRHVADRGHGCPLAALAGDLAREDGEARAVAAETVGRMARLLAPAGGASAAEGHATMALLLGSVALARLAESPEEAEAVLAAGQKGVDLLQARWTEQGAG